VVCERSYRADLMVKVMAKRRLERGHYILKFFAVEGLWGGERG
jgi:hypothetical protein